MKLGASKRKLLTDEREGCPHGCAVYWERVRNDNPSSPAKWSNRRRVIIGKAFDKTERGMVECGNRCGMWLKLAPLSKRVSR